MAADRALARAWRGLVWYLKGLTGESRYAAYVAHARQTHPEAEPMSEREFWREHAAWQDANPQGRCC